MHQEAESKSIHSDCDETDIKKENFSIAPDATSRSLLNVQKNVPRKIFGCKLSIKGIVSLVFGLLFFSLGILTTIYSILRIVMEDRLNMTPGLPSFELWYKSEPAVYCRIYLFNFTNSEAFLNGTDHKMKIEEIGPINYREFIVNSDVVHHTENSTMSYTIRRYIEFLPEMNEKGILNKTIIIPNIPLLTMAAILDDYSAFNPVKFGFNLISRKDKLFLNTTIYNFFWNLTTPALQTASSLDKGKFMVPVDNSGVLENIYQYNNTIDRVNVKIGKINGQKNFFKINSYNYRSYVPGYYPERGDCPASVVNSTEGAIFGGELTKSDVFYFFRKTICRSVPLHFEKEIEHGPFSAYKYIAKSNIYDRTEPDTDCYRNYKSTKFPDGLSDASKCYAGLPITISLPHFYDRQSELWNRKIEGFNPSKENHTSYTIIEPVTGTPLEQRARSQSNLILPSLSGFSLKISRFSNMVIPMMWVEYHLQELTSSITLMIYISTKVLPVAQYIIPIIFLLLGIGLIYIGLNKVCFVNSSKKSAKLKTKEFF